MKINKNKMIPVIFLLAVLLAAAGYTVFIVPMAEKKEPVYTEAELAQGEMVVTITESGYLEYEEHYIEYDLDLSAITQDDEEEDEEEAEETVKYLAIEEVYVAQGQLVSEKEALLKFSDDSVKQVRGMLQSALADAAVEYNEAEAEYRLAALEAENNLKILQTKAKYAGDIYRSGRNSINDEITLLQAEITNAQGKIQELNEAITEAAEEYSEAKAEYEEAYEKYQAAGTDHLQNYMVFQQEYQAARNNYEMKKNAYEQAVEQLESNNELMEENKKQINILSAQKTVENLAVAQEYEETLLSGENAGYSYQATIEELKQELKEAEEEKLNLEEKMEEFEALVGEDGILYAAADGRISQVSYSAGDTLERTGTLFTYIMSDGMSISVDVTQEDVVNLSVGDAVSIEFTSYEGKAYRGTIYSIDTTATSNNTPTISYTVKVSVEGTVEELYGGMSADIKFTTDRKENVIYVPRKALVEEEGKTYVWVEGTLGSKEKVEVTTGLRNESSAEILTGLVGDEQIYIERFE